jgi:hypothetical protein
MTALANPKNSARRETCGAEKRPRNREAMRRTLEREKTSLTDECTKAPNENKISHRWRERAWRRDVRFESWKTWSYAGQRLAASHG